MNSPLFISKVGIDWGKINDYSYLRNIPAISSIDELELEYL